MTDAGTPSPTGDAFGAAFAVPFDGRPTDGSAPDDFSDAALDREAPVTETPGGEQPTPATQQPAEQAPPAQAPTPQAPTTPPEQQPAPQPQAPQPGQAQEGLTPEQQEQQRRLAGRFETVEKLEDGYQHLRRTFNQTLQEKQQLELERQRDLAVLEQLKPYLPHLQELIRQGQVPGVPPGQELDLSQLDPAQQRAAIDQMVAQRVQGETQRIQTETQQQAQQQSIRTNVQQFMAAHPDVAPGTPLDDLMGDLFAEFQTGPDGKRDLAAFPYESQNLELVYQLAQNPSLKDMMLDLDLKPQQEAVAIATEAVANPALATVLRANPHLVDSPEGMLYARQQASLPGMVQTAQAQAAPLSPEMARRAAHVETGGTGAPVNSAPGQPAGGQGDEFDMAIDAWETGRSDNVFGLQLQD